MGEGVLRMIIDSHCHTWAMWPYLPAVPDPENHGNVEQLIHQMDTNGVDKATIVCAQIFQNFNISSYLDVLFVIYLHIFTGL